MLVISEISWFVRVRLKAAANSDGFIILLDDNLSVENILHLTLSEQVTTDAQTDQDGAIYLYGTFKGNVSIGGFLGRSNGVGLFLIKILLVKLKI